MQFALDKRNPRSSRDNMWKLMMEFKTFTVNEIATKCTVSNSNVSLYLRLLETAGYVSVKRDPNRLNRTLNTYTIVKRQRETPRIRKDGSEVKQGRGTEQMWRSMKMLKSFTPKDLHVASSTAEIAVKLATAKDYIAHLLRADYLHVIEKSTPKKQARYALKRSKYTGPKPPQIQRVKQVFDPNLGKVVWPVDGGKS